MSLRFAAARPAAHPNYLARRQMARISARAANDNADGEGHDEMLRAALLHFAECGLAAASDACNRARSAHRQGDRTGYLHWLAICRALDRQMAVNLAANLARRGRG